MNVKNAVKQLLTQQQDRCYNHRRSRLKVNYDKWVREQERKYAINMSNTSNDKGEFVILHQKAGVLGKNTLESIRVYFIEHPDVELVYGDEDIILENGNRANPWYKPCWSPDLFCSHYYFGSVIAVKRELWDKVWKNRRLLSGEDAVQLTKDPRIQKLEFEHVSEIGDLVYQLVTEAGGFRKGCHSIGHLEHVLFSVQADSTWQEYLNTSAIPAEVSGDSSDEEIVSVIIPSKDNPKILSVCLNSLHLENRPNVEVVIVDNGSSAENKELIEGMIADLETRSKAKISYLYHPMEFNFSIMCNMGVEHSTGKYLLFLNDDMEMCDNDWLEVMKRKASKPYVGAVGLKLYYPQSRRMQHCGIVNMVVGPMHKLQFLEDDKVYYFGRNKYNYNCIAVTGACLMLERQKFIEIGGFKKELRVAYNDVEIGFALVKHGYQNVVINERYAYHHESLSRGNDDASREKQERLERERNILYGLYPEYKGEDPYYPPTLDRQKVDFRVAPDYVNAKKTVQVGKNIPLPCKEAQIRWDECLMVRAEHNKQELIEGYSVVLGDNNACYQFYLVLIPINNEDRNPECDCWECKRLAFDKRKCDNEAWREGCVCVKLEGKYRQDLEENIPDQENVGLCGFSVNLEKVQMPKGCYEITAVAINKVTGLKLMNSSGKCLKI